MEGCHGAKQRQAAPPCPSRWVSASLLCVRMCVCIFVIFRHLSPTPTTPSLHTSLLASTSLGSRQRPPESSEPAREPWSHEAATDAELMKHFRMHPWESHVREHMLHTPPPLPSLHIQSERGPGRSRPPPPAVKGYGAVGGCSGQKQRPLG